MKFYDNGCFYSVSVSANEVYAFKQTWPCSRLPEKSIWFQFDKRNDDLVDMKPVLDGEDVLALSHDAQNYGKKKLAMAL
jgi:hypothetical protein